MISLGQMRWRPRWMFAVVICIVVVGVGIGRVRNEPRHAGKPLSYWFDRYAEGDNGLDNETLIALQHIGTNAVPFLIGRIEHSDSRMNRAKMRLWRLLPSFFAQRLKPPMDPNRVRMMAVSALRQAAPRNYESAIPSFVALTRHSDSNTRQMAIGMLGMLGPKAESAIPDLMRLLNEFQASASTNMYRFLACEAVAHALSNIGVSTPEVMKALRSLAADSDSRCRVSAASALWRLGAAPDEVLPIHLRELTNTTFSVRERALLNLGVMGPAAHGALPAIRPLLHAPERRIRSYASNAVSRIEKK